jgi:hypothetical protein
LLKRSYKPDQIPVGFAEGLRTDPPQKLVVRARDEDRLQLASGLAVPDQPGTGNREPGTGAE